MKKFLSIHIPRTGGGTFSTLVEKVYGSKMHRNHYYNGDPVDKSLFSLYDVIHGHFSYSQCKHIKNIPKIVWLREPIDRLLSRYFYNPHNRPWVHDDERLLRLARNQSNRQLKQIDSLNNFDLILRTEKFDESIVVFNEWSGLNIQKTTMRRNKSIHYDINENIIEEIRIILKPDIDMYQEFLEKKCDKRIL